MGIDLKRLGLGVVTGGGSELLMGGTQLLPEDTRSRIPGIGALTGAKSNEQKALERAQQQLAQEAQLRQQMVQRRQMAQMGNRVAALGPMNQHLASRMGPEAAFSPEMMSGFMQDPSGGPQIDPSLVDYRGTDPAMQAKVEQYFRDKEKFDREEQQRRQQVEAAFTLPKGIGPQPIQMSRPLAAKGRV